jgi:hypothetical protein
MNGIGEGEDVAAMSACIPRHKELGILCDTPLGLAVSGFGNMWSRAKGIAFTQTLQ